MAESRYFYHSFPRPRPGEPRHEVISRGLSILNSIRGCGLVLAPEIVEWHVPPSLSIGVASPLRIFQQRICFTELSPDKLTKHSETFGPFAMEFDIAALRRAGALPVIYMPQALSENDHLALIGLFVVSDLNQVRDLLQTLERVKSAATSEDHSVICLNNGDDKRGVIYSYSVSRNMVNDFMRFLTFERAPFSEMIGITTIAQSLFYPTDNRHTDTTSDITGNESGALQRVTTSTENLVAENWMMRRSKCCWKLTLTSGRRRFTMAKQNIVALIKRRHFQALIPKNWRKCYTG